MHDPLRDIAYCVLAPFVMMGVCLACAGDYEATFWFTFLPVAILSAAWTLGTRLGL